MHLLYATELFWIRKWALIFYSIKACPSDKMFCFQEPSVNMFYSILGSSCTGFPSTIQTQTYVRRELETTLKKRRNLEDSRSVLTSRLFGTAPVLDEYTVIYTASDLTELRTGSLQRTDIQDHVMMLCLETGINCTNARIWKGRHRTSESSWTIIPHISCHLSSALWWSVPHQAVLRNDWKWKPNYPFL